MGLKAACVEWETSKVKMKLAEHDKLLKKFDHKEALVSALKEQGVAGNDFGSMTFVLFYHFSSLIEGEV
ncbi:hypothetical protein U1Q18_009258 [Sarracenia purpurea var. burkii]